RWTDTFHLCEADHLRITELNCVDLIVWDCLRPGNGYRSRRRGGYLLVLQKPPLSPKKSWRDRAVCDPLPGKDGRQEHPHIKPSGLIRRLIGPVCLPLAKLGDPTTLTSRLDNELDANKSFAAFVGLVGAFARKRSD